jgi:hypothetical protein
VITKELRCAYGLRGCPQSFATFVEVLDQKAMKKFVSVIETGQLVADGMPGFAVGWQC